MVEMLIYTGVGGGRSILAPGMLFRLELGSDGKKLVTARIEKAAYRGVLAASTSPLKERDGVSNDSVFKLIQPGLSRFNSPKFCATGRATCWLERSRSKFLIAGTPLTPLYFFERSRSRNGSGA